MKKTALYVATVVSLCFSGIVLAEESEISLDVGIDYFGKYIWRGQNLSDDPVFQFGASVGWNNFTAAWWGNLETSKINGKNGEFSEHDWSLDYSNDVPSIEGLSYSVGLINYYFPTVDAAGETTEIYWGFAYDTLLSPSITVYHDVDEAKGTYASFAIGHSIENIVELTPTMPVAMEIGASLGWGNRSYNDFYWGNTIQSSKWNDLALSMSFPVDVAGWTFAPSINYVALMSGELRETDTFSKSSNYFFAGIGISKSF